MWHSKKFMSVENIKTWNKEVVKYHHGKTTVPANSYTFNTTTNSKIALWRGDITTLKVGAIVNAANCTLLGGGGVDGAIHRAAGPELYNECKSLQGCETGDAKVTRGYNLPAQYVIHTVGPTGDLENRESLLKSCYYKCLKLCLERNIKSIAFPCISTGIYGYDNRQAANVSLNCVRRFLDKHGDEIKLVILCLFLQKDVDIYYELCKEIYFPHAKRSSNKEKKYEASPQDSMKQNDISDKNTKSKKRCNGSDTAGIGKQATQVKQEKDAETSETKHYVVDGDLQTKIEEQKKLRKNLILKNTAQWMNETTSTSCPELKFVGGIDISTHKTRKNKACACLVVLTFPELKVVYKKTEVVDITEKYASGFLAFREVPHYKPLVNELRDKSPDIVPQVILVDGNGILHPVKFGSASQLGVECEIATIGVGKNFLEIPEFGIHKRNFDDYKEQDYEIKTNNGEILGRAIRNCGSRHIYVSIGHGILLESACHVVKAVSKSRIPEPIRQADQLSGEMLRTVFKDDYEKYHAEKSSKKLEKRVQM